MPISRNQSASSSAPVSAEKRAPSSQITSSPRQRRQLFSRGAKAAAAGGAEGQHRLPGKIVGLHKGFHDSGGLSPPDGKRQNHDVILLHVRHRFRQRRAACFIRHLLIGPAFVVVVIQILGGIRRFRLNAEQLRVQIFRGRLGQGPGVPRGGKARHQYFGIRGRKGRFFFRHGQTRRQNQRRQHHKRQRSFHPVPSVFVMLFCPPRSIPAFPRRRPGCSGPLPPPGRGARTAPPDRPFPPA